MMMILVMDMWLVVGVSRVVVNYFFFGNSWCITVVMTLFRYVLMRHMGLCLRA